MRGAYSTYAAEHHRPIGRHAAGVSYASFHPNVYRITSDDQFSPEGARRLWGIELFFSASRHLQWALRLKVQIDFTYYTVLFPLQPCFVLREQNPASSVSKAHNFSRCYAHYLQQEDHASGEWVSVHLGVQPWLILFCGSKPLNSVPLMEKKQHSL